MKAISKNVVFLTRTHLQEWQYSIIDDLSKNNKLESIHIIECAFCHSHKPNIVTNIHIALDQIVYKNHKNAAAFISSDQSRSINSRKIIKHQTIATKEDFEKALSVAVDEGIEHFIDFGNCIQIEKAFNPFKKLKRWQLVFGHSDPQISSLIGYEEILHHDSEIEILVTQSNSELQKRIQRRACYKLFPASLSKTRNYLLWRSADLLKDAILDETESSSCIFERKKRNLISELPNYALGMLKLAWRKKYLKSHWSLAFRKTDIIPDSMSLFKELEQPSDRFWADPFIIQKDDSVHVFIEELEYSKAKGDLAHFTIDKDGTMSEPIKILEKDYHLSYPFVFDVNGTYYMVPETSENRTIDLYRCEIFPEKWVFEKTLMHDLIAADTTLFFHDSKWWMFTTLDKGSRGSNDDELFLFYANNHDSSTWTPHPMNPIIRDVRSARPAGKIFIDHRKRIIRPSQDCSAFYGRGLNLNEIEVLSTTDYREKRIKRIDALDQENSDGVHTYNKDYSVSIIDQFRWVK